MNYTVQCVNGNKLTLNEDNYNRLKSPRRSMAGPLYAPMKEGEAIFFQNILMVIPENVEVDSDSWKDFPHVVRFTDGFSLGLDEKQRKSVERSLRETANKKFVELRNGMLIYHNRIWFIAHRESEWVRGDWEEITTTEIPSQLILENLSEVLTETVVALHEDNEKTSCCDTNSEIRYSIGKDNRKRFMLQCGECGKKGKMVKASDVEDPDEVLEVT